jgi:hypothetical protein
MKGSEILDTGMISRNFASINRKQTIKNTNKNEKHRKILHSLPITAQFFN